MGARAPSRLSRFPLSRRSCTSRPFTIWPFASLTPSRRTRSCPAFPTPAVAAKLHKPPIHDMAVCVPDPDAARSCPAFPFPPVAEKLRKQHIHEMAVCVPDPDAARASAQLPDSRRRGEDEQAVFRRNGCLHVKPTCGAGVRVYIAWFGRSPAAFPFPTVAEKLRKQHIHDMAVCVPDPDAARASAQLSDSPVAARMSRQRFIEKAVRVANYSASRRYLRRTAWLGRSRFRFPLPW